VNSEPRRVLEDDISEGSTEYHAKSTAPHSSEGEATRLELERHLSESLAAQTERDQRIAQLTDELALKSALLEQAEANATEAKKHEGLKLRELQARLDELLLSRDQHVRAFQNALQNATSRATDADERNQRAWEQIGHYETELAYVRAKLREKESELEAVSLRLEDAERALTKSKTEADTPRAQTAAGLVNTDVDQVMHMLMERIRSMEAEIASKWRNDKSIGEMECRNEG
jgi:chromosome segregation ATPase